MTRLALATILAVGVVACASPKGSYKGKLTSASSGQAMASVPLQMKAQPLPSDRNCHQFDTTTGADGAFEVTGLCADVEYVLTPKVDTTMLGSPVKVKGGVLATAVVDLKGWNAPKDNGVYTLTGDVLIDLTPSTQVGYYQILNSKEEARFPHTIPTNPPALNEGTWLVLSGKRTIDELHFYPMIESGPRKFGPEDDPKKSVAWIYIGTKFTSDTEFERVEASPMEGKFDDVTGNTTKGDKRVVRFVQADAFLPGWYALMGEKAFKTYVLNFGNAPAPKADAE